MYLALYRKYRPKSFDDVISQPHITTTLMREVMNNKTAHAYLFTGPRGTGKTTCSKILAMAVNCLNPIDGNPCLECDICKGIESGSILDVVEIDAASNNGVDNIRQLREEANYTPSQCKYRVYIIDETHMLSTGAFNALLKIMEEPPEHVKFILATTEAHKVPATILSRCQRFDFRRVKSDDIKNLLLKISKDEPFTLEEDAASFIARLADGGMRDALSLLDQCVAFSSDVTSKTVALAAGVVSRDYLFKLTECIINATASDALNIINELYASSKDLQSLLEEVLNHFRNIMLCLTLKKPEDIINVIPDELEKIKEFTSRIKLSQILYSISVMQETLDKMSRTSEKRLTLELCFVKLCTPSLNIDNDAIISRLELLENKIRNGVFSVEKPKAVTTHKEQVQLKQQEQLSSDDDSATKVEENSVVNNITETSNITNTMPSTPEATATPSTPPSKSNELVPLDVWVDVLAELSKTDAPIFGILNGSQAFTHGGFLYIATKSSFAGSFMKQEGNAIKVINTVENKTGIRYKLRIKSASPSSNKVKKNELDDFLNNAKQLGVKINEE